MEGLWFGNNPLIRRTNNCFVSIKNNCYIKDYLRVLNCCTDKRVSSEWTAEYLLLSISHTCAEVLVII
jgi:hypothetical protein